MDMRTTIDLLEGRVGTAVRRDEIPRQYKGMKVLGQGATSVAVEKDPNTVLMFTRDSMKLEWLLHMVHARVIEEYESHRNHMRSMNEYPIYVVEMPRYYPLSKENRRLVKEALAEFSEIYNQAAATARRGGKEAIYRQVFDHFSAQENHILEDLWNHLMNYDVHQFSFDLAARNFMQDAKGSIVILDPVVATEILNIMNVHRHVQHARKYPDQRW